MIEKNLNEISAKFEISFKILESDNFCIIDKLKQVDVLADYLYENSDDDYIDGVINENTKVFMFIDNMISNSKNCRDIVIKELEDREDYELLNFLTVPVSKVTEEIIDSLNIF